MSFVQDLKEKVLGGYEITREDAIKLLSEDLDELTKAADEIREKFHGDDFDFCSIVNARSGRCSENCKYCAQSSYYHTGAPEYKLLSADEIVADAKKKEAAGIPRYSIVTSGRTLSNRDVEQISEALRRLKKETKLSICLSAGLLNREQFDKLKEAGLTRFHNNLETYRRHFPDVCTTHTYDDKIGALVPRFAQAWRQVHSGERAERDSWNAVRKTPEAHERRILPHRGNLPIHQPEGVHPSCGRPWRTRRRRQASLQEWRKCRHHGRHAHHRRRKQLQGFRACERPWIQAARIYRIK